MTLDSAFDALQTTVNADPDHLAEARRRRDLFLDILGGQEDVDGDDSFASGSLARKTNKTPINDVDVVIIYEADDHPEWGQVGPSARDSLDYVGAQINQLMGATNGTECQEVRLARARNHAAKCFLDDPEDPQAFTVDVVPALRQSDESLLIPEALSARWIAADPQDLIRRVASRQAVWNEFVPLVRILKHWIDVADAPLKGLTIEVLALENLNQTSDRRLSLCEFFTAAAATVHRGVDDPAGLCGPVQPDLDLAAAERSLRDASDESWMAVNLEADGFADAALCKWREVLGDELPEPAGGCPKETTEVAAPLIATPRPIRRTPQG